MKTELEQLNEKMYHLEMAINELRDFIKEVSYPMKEHDWQCLICSDELAQSLTTTKFTISYLMKKYLGEE